MDVFKGLVDQDKAVKLLERAVELNRIAPAYLFCGVSGIGRSQAAKSFAQLLLSIDVAPAKLPTVEHKITTGNHPDLLWVEPTYLNKSEIYTAAQAAEKGLQYKTPPKIRIEQIRSLTQFLNRPILEANRKVIVIEEVQTMAESPANALLKTLEEPGNATLILIAPDADALLTTLVSRCQKIQFYPLAEASLKQIVEQADYAEIINYPEIIAIAQGSPGKAISAWQQLQTIPAELLHQLKTSISSPLDAYNLAKSIVGELDSESQLWLIDYLQHYYWQQNQEVQIMEQWEKTRRYLLSYVQPRLVWECALLNLLK